jgi:hypothetical protein
MRRILYLLITLVLVAGIVAFTALASGDVDEEAAPLFGVRIPPGYRDWRLISVAHEEGNLNDLRAILGNDVAINAYEKESFLSPTAQSLPGSPGATSRRRKTTKSLAVPNLSWPDLPQTGFSLWSRIQRNTRRPAAGGSPNLTTANPPTRLCTTPVFPATSTSKTATLSSPVTHLSSETRKN